MAVLGNLVYWEKVAVAPVGVPSIQKTTLSWQLLFRDGLGTGAGVSLQRS